MISHVVSPTPNARGWNNSPVSVAWSVQDPDSGIAASSCPPLTVSTDTPGVTATCTARNGAGLDASDAVVVRLDTLPPRLDTTVRPSSAGAGQSVTITVNPSEALAAPPTVSVSGACVSTTSVAMAASGTAYAGTFAVPAGSDDCQASVAVAATDLADNPSTGGAAAFGIDRSGPRLTTDVKPTSGRAGTQIGITVTPSEPLAVAPTVSVTGDCILDAQVAVVANVDGQSYSGSYTIPPIDESRSIDCPAHVQATGADLVGNPSVGGAADFSIDRTGPRLTTDVKPARGRAGDHVTITVTADDALAAPPAVTVSGSCVADAQVVVTADGQAYSGSYGIPFIDEAGGVDCTAHVQATATDQMGNPSTGGAAELQIDRAPPTLAITAAPAVAVPNATVSVTVNASEDLIAPPSISLLAVSGCIRTRIDVQNVQPTAQPRQYTGSFTVPDVPGNCAASIAAQGADLVGNQSTAQASLRIDPHPDVLLHVQINAPVPEMRVASGDGKISCFSTANGTTGACTAAFAFQSQVVLHAIAPAKGVSFSGWGGDCSGTEDCVVTMDHERSVGATFERWRTLTVRLNGGRGDVTGRDQTGTIRIDCLEPTCSFPVPRGAQLTLSAKPDNGFQFDTWSGCTSVRSAPPACALTVSDDATVTANFKPVGAPVEPVSVSVLQQDPSGKAVDTVEAGAHVVYVINLGNPGPTDIPNYAFRWIADANTSADLGWRLTPPPSSTDSQFSCSQAAPSPPSSSITPNITTQRLAVVECQGTLQAGSNQVTLLMQAPRRNLPGTSVHVIDWTDGKTSRSGVAKLTVNVPTAPPQSPLPLPSPSPAPSPSPSVSPSPSALPSPRP